MMNCFMFLNAKLRLFISTRLHLLGHTEGATMAELGDVGLRRKEELARKIMDVGDRVLPGMWTKSVVDKVFINF